MNLKCKICSGENIINFWPTIYNEKIRLYYCDDCNHGFLYPYFSKEELRNFYQKEYRKLFFFNIPFRKTKESVKKMSIDTGQLKESEERAKFIVSNIKNESLIVDIGSGMGMFLDCCYDINNSLKLYSVEFDEEHKNLSKNSDKIINFKSFEELEKLNKYFDVVTIFHTFEHIDNSKEFLNNLKKIINKNSLIYIEVPNGEFGWIKKNFVHLAHPQIFSKYSMTKVLNLSGYEILSYDRYNNNENYIIIKAKLSASENKQFLNLSDSKILKNRIINARWNFLDRVLEQIKKILITIVPPRYLGLISRFRYKINK